LPATRSMTSRPRAASRRRPDAVIELSGKASAAATLSRSGVSGLMSARDGNDVPLVIVEVFIANCSAIDRRVCARYADEQHPLFEWA
jgi:hypothetical protein